VGHGQQRSDEDEVGTDDEGPGGPADTAVAVGERERDDGKRQVPHGDEIRLG
jgi:hypothetical protein